MKNRLELLPQKLLGLNNYLFLFSIFTISRQIEVLSGATRLLSENRPPIFCELRDNDMKDRTIELLEGLGYNTMLVQDEKLVSYSGQRNAVNYFFLKN